MNILKNDPRILWITKTAACMALLIVLQAATTPLRNTLVTGSLVNLMLILSGMTGGLSCGLTVAILSPILAKFFGIGPLWAIIPLIALGNIVLVLLWHFIGENRRLKRRTAYPLAVAAAALAKCAVLYLGIVRGAVPLLRLPAPQAAALSGTFSLPQFFTAIAGGLLAILLLPAIKRALRAEESCAGQQE